MSTSYECLAIVMQYKMYIYIYIYTSDVQQSSTYATMHSGHALGKDRNLRVSSSDAIVIYCRFQKVVSFVRLRS